ncbi:MAG: hypothetical protein M3P33_01940 [bacterium]|nr:hypothetical protein [bacterium]
MLDSKQLSDYSESEAQKIRKEKDSVTLLNDRYNTPNTSLLLFHFEPHPYVSSDLRLKDCSIQHNSIEEKDLYIFDQFFLESESANLRTYSKNATFSRSSYACQESREKGEEPARSMNNKEKWEFFAKPPQPIKEVYKLLGMFANRINADISTLPWDLCDQSICASAVATNKLERASKESMEMGKHEDFNTEKGIPFGIPILYEKEKTFYPGNFINGAPGNPWLVSLMVYATEDNFLIPEYGLGTIFCKKDGEIAAKADCCHMRFVLFEGDILHSIEESKIPPEISTWRVSYVFKLIINPRESNK